MEKFNKPVCVLRYLELPPPDEREGRSGSDARACSTTKTPV